MVTVRSSYWKCLSGCLTGSETVGAVLHSDNVDWQGEGSEEGWRGRLSCIGSLPLAGPSCRRWTRWRLAPSSLSVSKYSLTRSVDYFFILVFLFLSVHERWTTSSRARPSSRYQTGCHLSFLCHIFITTLYRFQGNNAKIT